jgi:subtilase family serine protease
VTVRVVNAGLAATPEGIEVELRVAGDVVASATLPALASGGGVDGVVLDPETSWSAGEVVVDPAAEIPECETGNNRMEVGAP